MRNNKSPKLIGQRFGRLTALEISGRTTDRRVQWRCKCDCGNITEASEKNLKSGNTKSCGCLRKEKISEIGKRSRTHGESRTRLHKIWAQMLYRCKSKKCSDYSTYGGSGIDVTKEWEDFFTFKRWALSNGYEDHLTIDRIENDKGYYPENCRWATASTQARNRRTTKLNKNSVSFIKLYLNAANMNYTEIAKLFGVSPTTISSISKGKSWEEVEPAHEK